RDLLEVYVEPDVELGPVREREHADALALADAAIVDVPEFRPLVFRIPAVVGVAEAEHALLRARLFLVAARAPERRVKLVLRERRLQRLGLHDVRVLGAVSERRDPGLRG